MTLRKLKKQIKKDQRMLKGVNGRIARFFIRKFFKN